MGKEGEVMAHLNQYDEIVCDCGNTPHSDGFQPCGVSGQRIEPTVDDGWDGLYVCDRCQKVLNIQELPIVIDYKELAGLKVSEMFDTIVKVKDLPSGDIHPIQENVVDECVERLSEILKQFCEQNSL